MNSNKCDMCGLYLELDGAACEECINKSMITKKVAMRSQIGADYEQYGTECNNGEYGDHGEL
ncbi:hypothetical protein [Lacrimispora sp.]|jgi:hypothetical protein|uniref:hypothetical protein n=1 Tax=Lacrimispora sp. TaxID=2719234 RepID=UPI0026CB1E54|nr:hypothetical protein [Lacrimispora sp.]